MQFTVPKNKNQEKNQKKLTAFFSVLNWVSKGQDSFLNSIHQNRDPKSKGSFLDVLCAMDFIRRVIEHQTSEEIESPHTIFISRSRFNGPYKFSLDRFIEYIKAMKKEESIPMTLEELTDSIKRGLFILETEKIKNKRIPIKNLLYVRSSSDNHYLLVTPVRSEKHRENGQFTYYCYLEGVSLGDVFKINAEAGGRIKSQDCMEILLCKHKIESSSSRFFAPGNIVKNIAKGRSYSMSGHVTRLRESVSRAIKVLKNVLNMKIDLSPYSRLVPASEGVSIEFKDISLRRPDKKKFKNIFSNNDNKHRRVNSNYSFNNSKPNIDAYKRYKPAQKPPDESRGKRFDPTDAIGQLKKEIERIRSKKSPS